MKNKKIVIFPKLRNNILESKYLNALNALLFLLETLYFLFRILKDIILNIYQYKIVSDIGENYLFLNFFKNYHQYNFQIFTTWNY